MCKRLICLMAVLTILGPAPAQGANPGPVGWWKLDETSGTVAADAVAGNDGVLAGNPAWVAGQIDGALQFDGTDDVVTLPIGTLISTLGDTTVAAWANFSNAGGAWQRIFDFGSGSGDSPYMFLCPRSGTNGPMRFAIRTATVGEQIMNTSATLPSGWHHVAVTIDAAAGRMTLYQDGAVVAGNATLLAPKDLGVTTQNWLGKSQWPDALYMGALDEVRIYDRALSQDEIKSAMQGRIGYGVAANPGPADGAANVLPDVVLSWTPGQEAVVHNVYFGAAADDLPLLGQELTVTTLDVGRLEFGATYYWRVDEVSADGTLYQGNVWSFQVEPYAYVLKNIQATASSSMDATTGPGKTVDGSGLDAGGQHSTKPDTMWLSFPPVSGPTWIQYTFDTVCKLDQMLVWNYNEQGEPDLGYGAKGVTITYSVDGENWTELGTYEFAQAPGEPNCVAQTPADVAGLVAKAVKFTMNSNWSGLFPLYGLSEVRFLHIPVTPTQLSPASGTTNLDSPVTLSWRPGREAVAHQIYLGTDPDNLPLVATTDKADYVANVSVGSAYYWKVVAVNDAATPSAWESAVASFSTVAVPTNPGTTNLTHLYTFSDGTANDSVGNAHGVLVGGAAIVDGSLVTSAQDQWMEMPGNVIAMNTYDAVSVVVRYTPKAGANGGWSMLAYFGDSVNGLGSNGYFLTSARGDNISRTGISIGNVAAPWEAESGANGPEYDDGKQHLMISTIDATTIRLYIDGVLIASTPLSATNTISGISQNLAYLAKGGYTGDPEWIGAIHEFSIYNKALSPGEVLYLAQMMPKDPGTANLKHQYAFDDGTANDSVGAAHGVLVGGAAIVDGALVTSAQDQWMEMPGSVIAMNTYEAVSIASWYTPKAGANTGYHMLAYFGDSVNGLGSNGFFFSPARGNNVSRTGISIGNVAAPWEAESGANGPEYDDGKLHFVVCTVDATTIKLYIDGVLTGSSPMSATNKISGISQNFAYLAKGGYTGDPEWLGAIHDFSIYNRVLTAGEVRYLAGDE